MDIASVVSFFRQRPWQGELCLQISAVFGIMCKCIIEVLVEGNIWMITAKSRMTASTILGSLQSLFWDWARASPDLPSVPSSDNAYLEKGCRPWLVIIIEELFQIIILTLTSYVQPLKKGTFLHQIFTSPLSFEMIFSLFVFHQGICNKFSSLKESLLNKVFELLLFLSNLWHILHRVNNSRIDDILHVDSGPASVHLFRAAGFFASPTIPSLLLPQHLQVHGHDPALWKESMSLSCELQTNRCKILYVCTSGCLHGSSHLSRWCTESDLA